MSIDEKLRDILSWLNKHDLKSEAAELESLIKNSKKLPADSRDETTGAKDKVASSDR